MATKIRLQRGGRKSYAFYSIVIADARAPRDRGRDADEAPPWWREEGCFR